MAFAVRTDWPAVTARNVGSSTTRQSMHSLARPQPRHLSRHGRLRILAGDGYGERGRCQRPSRIILVRHGESEGNIDETVYKRKPDNQICLTQRGRLQAREAGKRIAETIGNDRLYFYVSPYMRAQETLYEIGSQFDRSRILGVREDARLREQDFGNFQDDTMTNSKSARLRFSRFFFRFRDGESAADVYDRVTTFRETLRNDINFGRFQDDNCPQDTTVVIVFHGLTLRVFLMRWYKWTVEMFDKVYNPRNAGVVVMEKGKGGRYSLASHHSAEELAAFGMTQEMIDDQVWQMTASQSDLNPKWPTSGPCFFDNFRRRLEAKEEAKQTSYSLPDMPETEGRKDPPGKLGDAFDSMIR